MASTNPIRFLAKRRYRSPTIPLSAIKRYARHIVEAFQPECIILFGSYAYGKPDADSDVDLLVVMDTRDQISQSVRIRTVVESPFALDLLVRTPKILAQRIADGNWFLREIVERGKVLYAKGNGPSGQESRRRLGGGKRSEPVGETA